MNLTQLPDLMREHAEYDSVPVLAESRITGIQRKVAAAHRRRIGGTVVVLAAVALAGIPMLQSEAHRSGDLDEPATVQMKTVNGFPEYALGGRLVTTQVVSFDAGTTMLDYTPTYVGLLTSSRCTPTPTDVIVEIHLSVNGHDFQSVGCSSDGGAYETLTGTEFTADGLAVGRPATLTFTAKAFRQTTDKSGNQVTGAAVALPIGTFAVGLWQALPFDQYPLPPRPRVLPTLSIDEYGADRQDRQTVTSDPADPLAIRTLTFTMPTCPPTSASCVSAMSTSQTPGSLTITIEGMTVAEPEFWDYSAGGWGFEIGSNTPGLRLVAGQRVTLTIAPQHVTGGWLVGILMN